MKDSTHSKHSIQSNPLSGPPGIRVNSGIRWIQWIRGLDPVEPTELKIAAAGEFRDSKDSVDAGHSITSNPLNRRPGIQRNAGMQGGQWLRALDPIE